MGGGMVAVVRGFGEDGLAVTLLDAGRQYTLDPNNECKNGEAKSHNSQQSCYAAVDAGTQSSVQCDSGIQVIDDAYVSTYKNAHCNITSTSPTLQLPEFPPQRAQWHRGQSNFEVGGGNSGGILSFASTQIKGFKEEMHCNERVSKPSREFDAFAKTLRKYPVPAAKSSETVQRLINYTTKRNCHCMEKQILLETSKTPKSSDRESIDKKIADEPPTRDDETERQAKKYLRKESCKSVNAKNSRNEINNNNSVNMEIQASADMVSKEVTTRQGISNVAVSLSPISSTTHHNLSAVKLSKREAVFKSIQTMLSEIKIRKSVQTLSSIDVRKKRCKNVRKTRSQQEYRLKKSDILEWFEDIFKDHFRFTAKESSKKNKCTAKQKDCGNVRIRFGECLTNVGMEDCKTDSCEYILSEEYCQDTDNEKVFHLVTQVFTANVDNANLKPDISKLKNIAYVWFYDIPMKSYDFINRNVNKDEIFNILFQKIIATHNSALGFKATRKFKEQIMNFLDEIPLQVSGCSNKIVYLNRLTDLLIEKLESSSFSDNRSNNNESNTNRIFIFNIPGCQFRRNVKLSKQELRTFVTDEIEGLIDKFELTVNINLLESIVTRIVSTFIRRAENCNDLHINNYSNFKGEIEAVFLDVGILSPEHATLFASTLWDNFIKLLRRTHREKYNVFNIFQNTCEISGFKSPKNKNPDSDFNNRIAESESYQIDYLVQKIHEWLRNLQIDLQQYNGVRIVKKLAEDILDRCKYLVLNPSSRGSAEEELSYLKYQIFKWVGKVVGEDNTDVITAAPDLMVKIHSIIDMYKTKHEEIDQLRPHMNTSERICKNSDNLKEAILAEALNPVLKDVNRSFYERTIIKKKIESNPSNFLKIPYQIHPSLNKSQPLGVNERTDKDCLGRGPCCSKNPAIGDETSAFVDQMNLEHANYLDRWIQEIPLPEESVTKENIEKVRQGILAAVWKAITKVKCNPEIYNNTYLFEDLFDDELEKIFDMIPDSPQLDNVKPVLKSKIIAKTSDTLRKLRQHHPNYRNQVIANVTRRKMLLTRYKTVPDEVELYEEFKIKKLVDNFILSVRYKEDDKVKANLYRKKLIKGVKDFVAQLKELYSDDLHEINEEVYRSEILNAMIRVPRPNEETIRQEVDKILLEIEVEKWFDDLPLIENSNQIEQQMRKRTRDILAKKIFQLEKDLNIYESCGERVLRHEISNFLDKMPLKKDNDLNINFMVEELVNRIKNRQKESSIENGTERRKSVEFHEALNYDEFHKNVPCQSTFTDGEIDNQSKNAQTQQFPSVGGYESFASYQPVSSSVRQDIDQLAYRTASFIPSVSEPIEAEHKWQTLHESEDITNMRTCVRPDGTLCCKRPDATEVDRRARKTSLGLNEPNSAEETMHDNAELRSGIGQNSKGFRDKTVKIKACAQDIDPNSKGYIDQNLAEVIEQKNIEEQSNKQKENVGYQRDQMTRISSTNLPGSASIQTQTGPGQGALGTSQIPGPSRESRPWVGQPNEPAQISRDNRENWLNQNIPTPNTKSLLNFPQDEYANQYGSTPQQSIPYRIPRRPVKEAAPKIPRDLPRTRLNFDNLEEHLEEREQREMEEDFRCRCLERYRAWKRFCERQDDNNFFPCLRWAPCAFWPPYPFFFP